MSDSIAGPCVVCGATDYELSMGGPTICPSCDCGRDPEIGRLISLGRKQAVEITRLREKLSAATTETCIHSVTEPNCLSCTKRILAAANVALEAWYSIFGTTQLSHAQARCAAAEKDAERYRYWRNRCRSYFVIIVDPDGQTTLRMEPSEVEKWDKAFKPDNIDTAIDAAKGE